MKKLLISAIICINGVAAISQTLSKNENSKKMSNQITKQNVQFLSEGLTLKGNLFLPENYDSTRKLNIPD